MGGVDHTTHIEKSTLMITKSKDQVGVVAFCEECGTRIYLTQDELERSPGYIHCAKCSEVVKIAQPQDLTCDLEIRLGDRVIRMDPGRPILTMGRKHHNDLVIPSPKVSRTHAAVVYLDDQYTLFDLSLNGTCVRIDGEEEVLLRKNKYPLRSAGRIGLGRRIDADPDQVVQFRIINEKMI